MLIGKLLPEYALYDVFIQFPGLEYVKLQKDQNFGYVQVRTFIFPTCKFIMSISFQLPLLLNVP